MVVDNKAYKSFGENMKRVQQHCKDLANIINAVSKEEEELFLSYLLIGSF